ncbi:hypothetical protein GGS23DRAFT_595776 [Durotheca rogersii]|uniref:uncharacterized protein n=1 Tax=Durotheca rogersii TaxID=419775 RepID=UPI00221E6A15|nr:uncharacterized protein GGS23DRAFT_595776 [Durotheca rogersii]KAI5864129.1 hypothetical protein GGS23DRAFT_595776 [Durotheca rogersii]
MPRRHISYMSHSSALPSPLPSTSLSASETGAAGADEGGQGGGRDWLAAAQAGLRRDLETSRMELELVRDALAELDAGLAGEQDGENGRRTEQEEKAPGGDGEEGPAASLGQLRDRRALVQSCHEYAGSRALMLGDRLRQVQYWVDGRREGREVPGGAPEEWHAVDEEWRRWLGEQAAAVRVAGDADNDDDGEPSSACARDAAGGEAVRLWGPLLVVLASCAN